MAKLNDDLFEWEPGEANRVLSDDSLYSSYQAYNAVVEPIPPALVPPIAAPSVPEIGTLCALIIASAKLFLIAHSTPGSTTREWSLVCVALRDTMSLHPNDLVD